MICENNLSTQEMINQIDMHEVQENVNLKGIKENQFIIYYSKNKIN